MLAVAALYWFLVRRWFGRWGAATSELSRVMAGDAAVVDPSYSATLAITVGARPEHIWPWLVQMGYRRGGLYSYDWLDRLFGYLDGPSADSILPECQRVAVGDVIPIGRGQGFPVTAIEPYRTLVLSGTGDGFAWAWQFGLYPLDDKRTRLVSRNCANVPYSVRSTASLLVMEPAAFIMTRKMLLGIKRRAERSAGTSGRREVQLQSGVHDRRIGSGNV